jgi:hypothetical protein
MTSTRGALLGLGLASAITVAGAITAMAGTQTATYTVPAGDLLRHVPQTTVPMEEEFNCGGQAEGKAAGACIPVGGSKIHIDIQDKTGQPTPGRVFFYDETKADLTPNNGDPTLVCASGDVDLPDGTAFVSVEIGVLGRSGIQTPPTGVPTMACGQPEPASTGTITVTGSGVKDGSVASAARAHSVEPGERAGSRVSHGAVTIRYAVEAPAHTRFRAL